MRILLFSPLLLEQYLQGYKSHWKTFLHRIILKGSYHRSLSLEMLAAVTPKKHEVVIRKEYYKNVNYDEDFDIIGIRTTTTDSFFAYKVADEFRRQKVPVVLGGWHASALPEEAKQHADAVVIGEAEETWPKLLNDFENGRLKPFYRPERPVDPKNIPAANSFFSKDFAPAIQASRGCPYQCEFCSETIMNSKKIFRPRPVENVVEEIKSIPGNVFVFHDASLTIDPKYTKKLFRSMIDLNKHFFCNGNVDTLGSDDELLSIAKKAGCVGWLIGFESISKESLIGAGKKTNNVNSYMNAIEKIHEHNMMVSGSFVFGFDGDTLDIFDKTKDFVDMSGIDMPDAMTLTPFPGTPLFNRLEKEGRILTKDWSKDDHRHVVFQPKNMTPEDLFENTQKIYADFFSKYSMAKRILKSIKLGYNPFISVLFQNLTMATMETNVELK